jgi:ketosteroid isomerase-like protein
MQMPGVLSRRISVAIKGCCLALLVLFMATRGSLAASPESEVRDVINQFQQAFDARDLKAIENLVDPAIVVFENGYRNDGWTDFRDHHLKPHFEEPATHSTWEIVKVVAMPAMAWAYTREVIPITSKAGKKDELLVWSLYVLERGSGAWKISSLSWSVKSSSK